MNATDIAFFNRMFNEGNFEPCKQVDNQLTCVWGRVDSGNQNSVYVDLLLGELGNRMFQFKKKQKLYVDDFSKTRLENVLANIYDSEHTEIRLYAYPTIPIIPVSSNISVAAAD